MNNFYFAVTIEENGKNYSYVLKIGAYENVAVKLSKIPGLVCASICPTKQRAENIVDIWNYNHLMNGSHVFSK